MHHSTRAKRVTWRRGPLAALLVAGALLLGGLQEATLVQAGWPGRVGWGSGHHHHGSWWGHGSWGLSLGFGGYWPYSGWGGWSGYDRYYLRPSYSVGTYITYPEQVYSAAPVVLQAPAAQAAQAAPPAPQAAPPPSAPAPRSAMSSANALFGR